MAISPVTPGSYFGDAVSQNGYGFEYLGKLYLFTYRQIDDAFADDRHFRCMRSTDSGATWAELGGLGPQWPNDGVSGLNSGWPIDYTVGLDGANAILLWVNATKNPTSAFNWDSFSISKTVFNLTTGVWGSVTTTTAPFMGMMDTADQPSTTTHSNRTSIYLIVRGPSNYLVYVPGVQSGTGTALRATATVVTYNGSSFGGAMPIPGQVGGKWYMPCGSVFDPASGNTHFLMAGGLVAGGEPNIYHVAMSSGNSYGSLSTVIDSSTSPGDLNAGVNTGPDGVSQPIIYSDGTTRKIGILSSVFGASTGFVIYVRFFSATEALNPTFTHVEVTTDMSVVPQDIPRFGAHAEVFSLAANSTMLIGTWITFNGAEDQPSDIYYSTSPVTGTPVWSTPVSVIPTPAALPATGGGTSPYVNVQGLALPMTGGFGVFGTAQQTGNYTPSFVSKFSFISTGGGGGGGPTITCGDPPDGALGDPYTHTFPVTDAPPGSTVAITSGALPPGLTLNPDTGVLSGTATGAGSYTFTVKVIPPITSLSTAGSVMDLPDPGLGWDYRQAPNAPIPGAIAGYEHGGVQYLFLYQGSEFTVGDSRIHALKSTDLGVTWTDTGNINIPPASGVGTFGLPAYTTCMDGNTVYLMAVDVAGTGTSPSDAQTGPLLLFKYDLTSNSFSSGSISGAPTVWKGWAGSTYSPNSSICLHLLRRGSGDMLLLYTGVETIGANKYARIYITTFNGTACGGTGTMLPGQAGAANLFIERCACMDASGNLHVILSSNNFHFWYHVAMDSAGSFGTVQTVETDAYFQNDTSNLLSFPVPADTIAFLGVRNRSSSGDNGDLAIYSAPGGSLNPTWTFHNLPSTANAVQDPVIAPDWIAGLSFLDGTLYAFWTQTGVPPSWSVTGKMGQIRGSTAVATDLATWTAETSVMGPLDSGTAHWGASQVAVWNGPEIGLGVLGNFEGYDSGGTGNPIETSKLVVYPPAGGGGGGSDSVTCTIDFGYGTLSTSCGSPPVMTVGQGARYRPPVVMGTIGLPPVYDQAGTLVWTFPTVVPPGFHWETNPASPNYGYLVGVPTQSGVQGFTYTVSSPDGQTVTNTCPLTVEPANGGGGGGGGGGSGSITIFCGDPPGGTVGVPYNHTLPVVGATGPTVYSVVVGALPPGVTLDPATGDLSGTPTAPGTYSFSVKVQQ